MVCWLNVCAEDLQQYKDQRGRAVQIWTEVSENIQRWLTAGCYHRAQGLLSSILAHFELPADLVAALQVCCISRRLFHRHHLRLWLADDLGVC